MEKENQILVENLYQELFEKVILMEGISKIEKQETDEKKGWKDYPEVIAC